MSDSENSGKSARQPVLRIWIVGLTPDSEHRVHSDNEVDVERARIQAQFHVDQGTYTRAWVLGQQYEVRPSTETSGLGSKRA